MELILGKDKIVWNTMRVHRTDTDELKTNPFPRRKAMNLVSRLQSMISYVIDEGESEINFQIKERTVLWVTDTRGPATVRWDQAASIFLLDISTWGKITNVGLFSSRGSRRALFFPWLKRGTSVSFLHLLAGTMQIRHFSCKLLLEPNDTSLNYSFFFGLSQKNEILKKP